MINVLRDTLKKYALAKTNFDILTFGRKMESPNQISIKETKIYLNC